MSVLRDGDSRLHYADGSHRWYPSSLDVDQQEWEDRVRAHVADHCAGADTQPPPQATPTRRGGDR